MRAAAGSAPSRAISRAVLEGVSQSAAEQEQMGVPSVLLVPSQLRSVLSRFLRRSVPNLSVLAHNEIPDGRTIRIVHTVGG